MREFWAPNLSRTGRLLRAAWGVLLAGAGFWAALAGHLWIGGFAVVAGCFALFEAARGWCIVRACGMKTRY